MATCYKLFTENLTSASVVPKAGHYPLPPSPPNRKLWENSREQRRKREQEGHLNQLCEKCLVGVGGGAQLKILLGRHRGHSSKKFGDHGSLYEQSHQVHMLQNISEAHE